MTVEYLKKAGKTAAAAGGIIRLFPQGRRARVGLRGYLRRHDAIYGDPVDRINFNYFVSANRVVVTRIPVFKALV